MEIIKISIDQIKPALYNPRKDLQPGDPEYEKIKRSMKVFDLVEPLVWNKRTGNLVGGHQRLKVLKEEGVKEVEVSVVDLTETKEKFLNIALNKIQGEWELPKLKDLLQELDNGEFDIEITGFSEKEIEDLMNQLYIPADNEKDDLIPEVPEQPITKPGDLYKIGEHRLLCGDATILTDVEILMGGRKAEMVFTDPPYNVDYGVSKNPRHKIRKIINDSMSDSDWITFNKNWVFNAIAFYDGGDFYVWGASGPDGMRQRLLFIDMGFHWSATIVWKKQQLVLSPAKYQRMYEPCFYGWLNKSTYKGDRKQTEVWEIPRPLNSESHPTMKPVLVCQEGIDNSSKLNDIVLDLFGGSGSTLIACEKLNRKCYMMEIDPHYCDVIVKRWENYVGRKAELIVDEVRANTG